MEKKEWEKDFEVLFGDIERKDYIKAFIQDLFEQELDKAREEGYENGLEDLHSSDIYQEAICDYGEWSQEGMDEGFEEAKKDLLSKLKQ